METKVYHCTNPKENPLPEWMHQTVSPSAANQSSPKPDPVTQFKSDPDAFFPDFINKS